MAQLMQAMIPNALAEVSIAGRVTRDAGGARFTDGGAKVANVSIAVSRRYQVDAEWKEETAFYTVAVWGDAADRAGQCKKGDIVCAVFSMADMEARIYDSNGEKKAGLQVRRGQIARIAWLPTGNGAAAPVAEAPAEEPAFPF